MDPKTQDEINRLNKLGRACIEKEDLEGALEEFSRALELLPEESLLEVRARLLNNVGLVQARIGKLDDAIATFHNTASIYEELDDPISEAWQMANVGSACRDKEDHEEALKSYNVALDIFTQHAQPMGIADQACNIGYIHAMKHDPHSALEWFEKALTIYQEKGEERKAELTEKNIERLRSALES